MVFTLNAKWTMNRCHLKTTADGPQPLKNCVLVYREIFDANWLDSQNTGKLAKIQGS